MSHLVLMLLAACGGAPTPTDDPAAGAIALARGVAFAELDLPADNRPAHREAPEWVPVTGFKLVRAAGKSVWEAPMPVHPRAMFFGTAPRGMVVKVDGTEIPHRGKGGAARTTWSFDGDVLQLTLPASADAAPTGVEISYPPSTEREGALNLGFSGSDPATFARATVQIGGSARTGLLLPAPGVAAWDVTLPPAAELRFGPGLVPPEILDAAPSDGARLRIELEADGTTTPVWSGTLREEPEDEAFAEVRVDLSAWSGRRVRLRARSETLGTADFDYVFLSDPVVASNKASPRRVILVFVDTLRPDHLGVYGYDRNTSAPLDAWAGTATVFDNARSVAPWTLPTARSVTTGRHPELYATATTLQGRLAAEGWASAMFAGNVYLSSNFDIHRDWGLHRVENWPLAEDQVDRGLRWLDAQDGRDAVMLLHLMDAHLPYREPYTYRTAFAGAAPRGLGEEFSRTQVLRARPDAEGRAYIVDRYDNNILYIHDQLARLFAALGPNDVVVYFADHGEELWDHGGFEHGHTLYDELLRVPLIIAGPGVPAGRIEEPVSLLDVTPTVLDLVGMPDPTLDGVSLLPAMRGDDGARADLAARDLAFGRPLYGAARWGVLTDGHKYTTTEGTEELYDLTVDPGEQEDLLSEDEAVASVYRGRLGGALDTVAPVSLRLEPTPAATTPTDDLLALVHVPGGVAAAWVADDPTAHSAAEVVFGGEYASVCWMAGYRGSREVFVQPVLPLAESVPGTSISVEYGPVRVADVVPADAPTAPSAKAWLVTVPVAGRALRMGYGIAPVPSEAAQAIDGTDAELTEALRAIGYAVGDAEATTACSLIALPTEP